MNQRPDMDDLPHTEWRCEGCGKMNSMWDGECQFCDIAKEEDHDADENE
jgi:predicted ATP-dependent serine protease